MENDIDQISVEFNDDELVNDSFSDSNIYESVAETYHGSSDPRVRVNETDVNRNQEPETTEYAIYDDGHRQNNCMNLLRLHWKKIIIILFTLAITISVALVLKSPSDNSVITTEIPTNNPTDIPTDIPTDMPRDIPTDISTDIPTDIPRDIPTYIPTYKPTDKPTGPATAEPTTITSVPRNDYTDWEAWSKCSQSCGQGESVRERKCLRNPCTQSLREAIKCNIRGCEFHQYVQKHTFIKALMNGKTGLRALKAAETAIR